MSVEMPALPLPRGVKVALLTSLALNALFIGGLASAFVRHNPPAVVPNNIGAYVQTLPGDRRRTIWSRTGDARKQMQPLRLEVRQARREVLNALVAEPYDKSRFVAAENKLIEAEQKHRLRQRDLLADIAETLTADERRGYIRWRPALRGPGGNGAVDVETQSPPKPQ